MAKISGGYTIWSRKNTINSKLFYEKPDKWFKIWFYVVNAVNYLKNDERYIRGQRYITYEMIADKTRATFSQIKNCIKYLKDDKQIDTQKTPRGLVVIVNKYEFYQDPENYKDNNDDKHIAKHTDKHIATQYNNKEKKDNKEKKKEIDKSISCAVASEIVSYLNEQANKKFRADSRITRGLINGRLNEGYTTVDFKRVIDNKVIGWRDDEKMNKFLRPKTLFCETHFEEYLNESKGKQAGWPGI